MAWLGEHPWLLIPLAVVLAYVIIKAGFAVLHMLGTEMAEPGTPETRDVESFDLRYRCIVCATEVRMTRVSGDDFSPPRHCREDMALVVEANSD